MDRNGFLFQNPYHMDTLALASDSSMIFKPDNQAIGNFKIKNHLNTKGRLNLLKKDECILFIL